MISDEPWVPEYLPQVSVGIAEVTGVDPPGTVVRLVCERRSGGLGLGEHGVDLGSVPDRLADAELAGLRRTERYVRVVGVAQTLVPSGGFNSALLGSG